MKNPLASSLLALLCVTVSLPAATLVHRYEFGGNLNDSAGGLNATAPAGESVASVSYGASRPARASGPVASVQLGKDATKVSGFTIPAQAIPDVGSVSLWFQADQANAGEGADYIFNMGGTYNRDLRLALGATRTALEANAANTNTGLGQVQAGTWYHVVITWDRKAGIADFYLNGTFVKSRTWQDLGLFSPSPMRVGNWAFSPRYLENQFRGSIYDIQIYSGRLDLAEVRRLHATPGGVIKSGK